MLEAEGEADWQCALTGGGGCERAVGERDVGPVETVDGPKERRFRSHVFGSDERLKGLGDCGAEKVLDVLYLI